MARYRAGRTRRQLVQGSLALAGLGLLSACGSSTIWFAPATAMRQVGWLQLAEAPQAFFDAFRDELRTLGYVEGHGLVVEARSADAVDQLPALAEGMVRLRPEVIVSVSTPPTQAAKDATGDIPIVFTVVSDPVGAGFVRALGQPGGNLTGLTNLSATLGPKRLELLHETVPGLSRVAVLWNATNRSFIEQVRGIEAAASSYGIVVQVLPFSEVGELEGMIDAAVASGAEAFVDVTAPYSRRTAQLLAAHRLPTMFQTSEHVRTGGLLSYGPSLPASFRRAASYVDKIFRGAKPSDLPVEQPTSFEFVINLNAAHALGLTVPQSVLQQATEIIQ